MANHKSEARRLVRPSERPLRLAFLCGRGLCVVFAAGLVSVAPRAAAGGDCVPLLVIDRLTDPPFVARTDWQVLWGRVPLSDAQVALLGQDDALIAAHRAEVGDRGAWVYAGTGVAALGAATSSVGWILWGQGKVPQGAALGMAAGGVLIGVVGLLIASEAIQTPMEPYTAPAMEHRISRSEMRMLVASINKRLLARRCLADSAAGESKPENAGRALP